LIKNQIDKLEKIYPHTFVKEFRLYLKSHKIPFITKFPFNDCEGCIVMCFDPNDNPENYYGEEKAIDFFQNNIWILQNSKEL